MVWLNQFWLIIKNTFKITFDKASLKLAINFLFDNCFLNFGNVYFRQVTGIAMVSDSASFMANLFLYYYENKWLLDTTIIDLCKACLFSNKFCFIEDLCAINNHLDFDRNLKNIYPSVLQLRSGNISSFEASFMDLFIKIEYKNIKI